MQTIDLEISRRKFCRELDNYIAGEMIQRNRGIHLLRSEFPNMIFSFAARKLQPAPVMFAVIINFDNYDIEPPSVRFVDPFTWEILTVQPINMLRKVSPIPPFQDLIQKEETGLPFICLPGIREYHLHPAHTGDPWLDRRGKGGEGTLGFIIDKLYDYGISALNSYQLIINSPRISISLDPNLIPV